jgi:hypothetical protein
MQPCHEGAVIAESIPSFESGSPVLGANGGDIFVQPLISRSAISSTSSLGTATVYDITFENVGPN